MWRKNRRVNEGASCDGVDLNRNFDDHFGGEGTSPLPCSETYKGISKACCLIMMLHNFLMIICLDTFPPSRWNNQCQFSNNRIICTFISSVCNVLNEFYKNNYTLNFAYSVMRLHN